MGLDHHRVVDRSYYRDMMKLVGVVQGMSLCSLYWACSRKRSNLVGFRGLADRSGALLYHWYNTGLDKMNLGRLWWAF